jgi:glycerol dehydrogenase
MAVNGVHYVTGTPNAYMQEVGLIHAAGEWISKFGKQIFIVTGTDSWASIEKKLTDSLDRAGIIYEVAVYEGECSYKEISRLNALVNPADELIVGVGAGKVMDIAKKLSNDLQRPFIAIPTVATNCAAATNLSVMYTDDGHYYDNPFFYRNTLLVLVDTDLMAKAPERFLIAGIGSAIATWYESAACASGKRHNLPTLGAIKAAKLSYDTILEYGITAIEDARQHHASLALQKVIDAIILFGGMVCGMGENNCRWAAAHAVYNGLISLPASEYALHGEIVAYGTLVQLALEDRPQADINELVALYKAIGLPTKLGELGIEHPLDDQDNNLWINRALSVAGTMGNMPFEVTAEALSRAIEQVEQWEQIEHFDKLEQTEQLGQLKL